MQNTIVKEFSGNPHVVAAIFDQGGAQDETLAWLQTFWDNYYLRGNVIFDENGFIGESVYGQPSIGLPFGRGFIIDPDGLVALPYFGHQPRMVTDKIYELLGTSAIEPDVAGRQADRQSSLLEVEAHPSLFYKAATVTFSLTEEAHVQAAVFDACGARVRELRAGALPPGLHSIVWDGCCQACRQVPAGCYFIRVDAGGASASVRVIRPVR